jgi:hypothetical protein
MPLKARNNRGPDGTAPIQACNRRLKAGLGSTP